MVRVRDIMTPYVVTLEPGQTLREAVAKMSRGGFRRLPVMSGGVLVGIITDRDIRQALNSPFIFHERAQDDYLLDSLTVSGSMTENPLTIEPSAPLAKAARIMETRKISGLPVLEGGRLVGIVTVSDLVRYLVSLLEGRD